MPSGKATQRTLTWLRERGYTAEVVEKWVPWSDADGKRKGNRRDLFGFADIIAFHPEHGILAAQTFTTAWKEHEAKLLHDEKVAPLVAAWRTAGGRVLLIGWRKLVVKRGGKAKEWRPRIGEVRFVQLDQDGGGDALVVDEVAEEGFDVCIF